MEGAVQQLQQELGQARAQILRQADALAALRAECDQAIRASEERTRQLLAAQAAAAPPNDRFDIIDFKAVAPAAFNGRREESWKKWSRKFRTYCNARRDGFRAALQWAEKAPAEINESTIDQMGWPQARTADSKLYDFLLLITGEDALVLVEHYEGQGFEAWR